MATDNIDYKKLLKRCMEHWIEAEGGCWDGDYAEDTDLSIAEKNTLKEIHDELAGEYEKSLECNSWRVINVNGKPFRCECGCNIFIECQTCWYRCTSCGNYYKGEK